MRIHTNLTRGQIDTVLANCISRGTIAAGTHLDLIEGGSRSAARAFDFKMVTSAPIDSYNKRRLHEILFLVGVAG